MLEIPRDRKKRNLAQAICVLQQNLHKKMHQKCKKEETAELEHDLESPSTEFRADKSGVKFVQYNPEDNLEAHIRRQKHVENDKTSQKLIGNTR